MKMTTVKKYTCDFCKKSKYTIQSMRLHEKHCTMNPDRECRMCCFAFGGSTSSMAELLAIYGDGSDNNLKALRNCVDGCPACILATIRQAGINHDSIVPEGYQDSHAFDFKAESKKFLEDHAPETDWHY